MILPRWMRTALGATAVMNLLGAFAFVPNLPLVREQLGFPSAEHPLYLWIVAAFIFIFGVAYAHGAWAGRASRGFIGVAAAGKLTFFAILVGFWLADDLPGLALLGGSGDLLFGSLFLVWLAQTRGVAA